MRVESAHVSVLPTHPSGATVITPASPGNQDLLSPAKISEIITELCLFDKCLKTGDYLLYPSAIYKGHFSFQKRAHLNNYHLSRYILRAMMQTLTR